MDTNTLPKQQSSEKNPDGRPTNLPGIYKHKETGARYITVEGTEGVIQADALMSPVWKDSWERIGDVPSRVDLLKLNKTQQIKDEATAKLEKDEEEAEIKARVDEVVKYNKAEAAKESK